jgi:hypothetical protein
MSGLVRRRRPWPRLVGRLLALVGLLALTGTLAMALQVREVRVSGTHRFNGREVERVLRSALGTPTLAARPEALRAAVRALPWVDDANVHISLDGIVQCAVNERTPAALAEDGADRVLLDASGRVLGPAEGGEMPIVLAGFAPFAEERAVLLAAVADLEQHWGGRLERAQRLGPHDVRLFFAGAPCALLADPLHPGRLADARRVLVAWQAGYDAAPQQLDARVAGRVGALPAVPPPSAAEAR